MSAPASLAGDLYERLGHYRTLGWAATSWPLNEERIDERAFMEDLFRAFDDRTEVLLQRLDTGRWDLLVGVVESTDRVQHMMWRLTDPSHPRYDAGLAASFGDAIQRVYERCDEFVGEVVSRLDPATPILIVSAHGFHSFRQAVNLNTWLVEQGYMTLNDAEARAPALGDVFDTRATFWDNVDWAHTRAYAFGYGQIFLNVKGREARGIVEPTEAAALAAAIAGRLRELRDPATARPVVREVYRPADVYSGPFVGDAADLQVGLADGYRVSWETTLGAAPPGVIVPNLKKWSGDHASLDPAMTAGTLISSRPIAAERPRLVDIAATVLQYFGIAPPEDLDGKALF
jgi:predicted AlkP superfamily phosphohydrolase/phosphomutase